MIRALGQTGLIPHIFHFAGHIIAVDELGIAEHAGGLAEQLFNALAVAKRLFPEFIARKQKGQAVAIGFIQKFHTAGAPQRLEAFQHFGGVFFKLVQSRAGQGEADLELALVFADEVEQHVVHGQIALARHLEQNIAVGVFVLVKGVRADVEKGVVTQPVGLMDLKNKSRRRA